MVRETRHLWVGNLPENIREDRIREHFKRYGRVQSVKLLSRASEEKTGEVSMACTVAFMDIKSASKAHNAELKIDDRTLNTEYYEPPAIPSAASPQGTPPPYSTSPGSTRFPNGHGSSDEHGFPDTAPASTRFYERSSSTGGSGVNRTPSDAPTEPTRRGAATPAPEGGSGTCRGGRNRDRFRGGGHRGTGGWVSGYESSRYNNSNERSQSETTGYNLAPSDTNERRNSENVRKKAKSRSGSRSPSPNGSTSSRSPSRSRSRSSSSSSSSSTSRDTSSTSSRRSRRHRQHKKASQCNLDDRRPLGICVRNLPVRSSDTSLKDGLFHEYKKHGKVTWVKIVGQNADRYAIVCFKKPEDAEKALEVSYDKLFFGCKIEVAPYAVCDVDESEFRYESEIDEYNPKATRTLFIGNLEKDVTASDLRKNFDQFGEIIEIDIKKQGAVSSYAFCQYADIVSVVKAIRKMDGEHLGNNRIKLGFGKSMAYNCVWIDGVNENVNEKYLKIQFEPFGVINKCIIDREKGQALIFYEHVSQAQVAVSKMRGFVMKTTKLQVDFASRECQECFFERLEKQGTVLDRTTFDDRRDTSTRNFDSSAPTRLSRYDTPTRPRTSSYSSRSSAAAVASPGTPGSATPRGGRTRVPRYYDYELDYGAMEGRHPTHRSYDEYSQGSAASHEDPYDTYDHGTYLHDSPGHLEQLEVRVVQNLMDSVPYAPHDIRNLQKERVHLLEQLEECPSSGDELISPKKRMKLDLMDPAITGDVIIEANRDHNRKVMEVRRLETPLRHHSRRPSVDNKYGSHYAPHAVGCKRRRTGGSDGGTRSGGHYAEQSDGSEQGGSRPGTPLCDENPEFPPGEPPKRTTREREGPLMLPLPKFAAQVRGTPEFQRGSVSVAGIKGQKDNVNPLASPPPAATSPRVSHHHVRPPSPTHNVVPPPASPPPRPPSLSSNSSDSDGAPPSPSLEERIKSLDEKYEKWSGSRSLSAAGNDALALLDANREKFRLRHKLLEIQDLKEVQPSEIVKSVMAKRSVFDEDLKRLESVGEKYEPKEFGLFSNRLSSITSTVASTPPVSNAISLTAPSALKLTTVSAQLPKTPTMLSPRSSSAGVAIPATRGLQYPFPSHPPTQQMSPAPALPQTTLTTTALITAPSATSTSTTVAARGSNLGENRLKPMANVPGDSRTSSSKNRSVANGSSGTGEVSSVGKIKSSEKITLRRNSSSTSPRADVKTRRNSDTSARRIEDKSEEQKLAERAKEEVEKAQREQEERDRIEKERVEKEKQEKERLERERKEKERLERESELEKQRLEKERLDKERIQKEKEKAERERKAKLEKERLENEERERKEREERERKEKERREREERELQEKLERERKEREEREQKAKEDEHRKEKERRRSEDRGRHKDSDNHHERSSKHHSETKHRENNTHHTTKDDAAHKRDSHHDNFKHETIRNQMERDAERRKESIKENRDNNIHDKQKNLIETKDHKDRAVIETRHLSIDLDKNQILEAVKDPNKRKERNNSLPATIGLKRRMSSHESLELLEESKKLKLGHEHKKVIERRDSKDSSKSDEKVKKNKQKNNSTNTHEKHNSEERRKDRDKDRDERHKKYKLEKQKSKSKTREKEVKEVRDLPQSQPNAAVLTDKDFLAKLNLKSNEEIEREKQKKDKEKRLEPEKRLEEKKSDDKFKKEKQSSFDSKEPAKSPQEENKIKSDDRKGQEKHSIFEIVNEEPPYISMYDKVKARSCKNMQKQEEEKRQEKIKAKFSQLKLSRARREEKKRSTSWDEDSDSDKEIEVKSRRCRKVLDSSDESQERKVHHRRKEQLHSDSDNSLPMRIKTEPMEGTDDEIKSKHASFKGSKSRITSDTSDDEYEKSKVSNKIISNDYHEKKMKEAFSENDIEHDLDIKPEKITSVKNEIERLVKKERRNSKFQEFTEHQTLIALHSEPSEVKTEKLFDNTTDDDLSELKKDKADRREKKHKKKQKKQKHSISNEESCKTETESVQGDVQEKKHHDKKKDHSKKDKKREKTREGRDKPKKSKKNKSDDNADSKREGKMENIFGSLSEDSENGHKDQKPFFADENAQDPSVYNTDSEREQDLNIQEDRDREAEHKRKKERKRREKERRLQEAAAEAAAAAAEEPPNSNDNSMDFVDMGKQLEANIKDDTSEVEYKTEIETSNLETSDTFAFTDHEMKKEKEERKEGKEKKKKRKKSKDEKKHHHHHHSDKSKNKISDTRQEKVAQIEEQLPEVVPEIKIEPLEDNEHSVSQNNHSQSLPNLLDAHSPTPEFATSPNSRDLSPIPNTPTTSKIKKEKLIPGFGRDIDETVHENAVKSICTEFKPIIKSEEAIIKEDVKEEVIAEPPEDKPRVVISQEETEDAVAALLGESFGSNHFEERYVEEIRSVTEDVVPELVEENNVQDDEEMRKAVQSLEADDDIVKPDTPQSEHELQIDTDTEEQEDAVQTIDQMPKTPETPTFSDVKAQDAHFFPNSEEKTAAPSPIGSYKPLGSPPSLTPIKPITSVFAEVKKNIDEKPLPEKQFTPQKSVIAQTWPAERVERKEVVIPKIETEAKTQVVLSSAPPTPPVLKTFTTSPTVKINEANYPPLAKLSPSVDLKAQTSVALLQPVSKPPVISQLHNLPARSPVQMCKSAIPEGILSPSNVHMNRLPITSVVVSKPMQTTTIYLPQPKVAHSSEPPKLVATSDPRQQERPRMICQPSFATFPQNQAPRMLMPGNMRHLPIGGLLVPTRQMNPAAYGQFVGNVPHSSSYSPLPLKESPQMRICGDSSPSREGALKMPATTTENDQIKSTIVIAGSHGAHTSNSPRTAVSCSSIMNPPHLILTSPKPLQSTSALSPRPYTPTKSLSPSQTFVAPPSPRQSPKPISVITETTHSTISHSPESPLAIQTSPKASTPDVLAVAKTQDLKTPKESLNLLGSFHDSRTSTPSPVIVPNPEVKPDNLVASSPIQSVTEELNKTVENNKEIVKEEIQIDNEIKQEVKPIDIQETTTETPPADESKKTENTEKIEKPKLPEDTPQDVLLSDEIKPDKDEDPLETKDDNEFWSAKDSVNIDSVIKTLGSADEMSDTDNKVDSPKAPQESENKELPQTPEKKMEESVPSETKAEEESDVNDTSVETEGEQKVEPSVTRSSARRGRGGRPRGSKPKGNVERGGIQTRRGKLKEVQAQSVMTVKRGRGGKVRTERKSSKSESSDVPTNDVYEFRDDSDDNNKEQRPRLVLTIKSTTSSTSNSQTTAIVKEITKDGAKEIGKEAKESPPPPQPPTKNVQEQKEEFTSPQTNTRKSRRLAEKDVSRNTVDDTIEDVIKNTPQTRSASNQRRSGRQVKKPQPLIAEQDTPRKSPRGRKPLRRGSEATENSSSEETKEETAKFVELPMPRSPAVVLSQPPPQIKQVEVEKVQEAQTPNSVDPTKEKKSDHCSLKTAMLKRFKGEMGSMNKPEPTNLIDPVTGVLTPMRESEEGKYIPLPGSSPGDKKVVPPTHNDPGLIKTSQAVKSQPSVIAQPHQITVVQQQVPKIHPLKAHVLSSQAAKAVVSEQINVVQPKLQTNIVSQAKEMVPQVPPISQSVVVSKTSTPKPGTPATQTIITSANVQMVGPLSPRPGIPVAVTSKPQVKPPVLSPSQQLLANQKHILQTREQMSQQIPNAHISSSLTPQQAQLVNAQVAHLKHRHEVIIGAKGQISKPPHTVHLTGQVAASPPMTKAQGPGRIIQGLPQAGAKNITEPAKIDPANLLVTRSSLSPSGPPGRLVGLSLSAYEANLGDPMSHYQSASLRHPADLNPAHYMHPQQYMHYQQYLRQQFQRSSTVEKSGEEGEEAPVGLALSDRGATLPHHSPRDRAPEPSTIGQVYTTIPQSARLAGYHPTSRYYDQQATEPPPAHRPLISHDRASLPHIPPLGTPDRPPGAHTTAHSGAHIIPERPGIIPERPLSAHLVHDRSALSTPDRPHTAYAPPERPQIIGTNINATGNILEATPKHVSHDQTQREVDAPTPALARELTLRAEAMSVLMQYPLVWHGNMALKNDLAPVRMYFISGNNDVAKYSLPKNVGLSGPPLRIFQRMRLEQPQVDGVARKMQMENEHCMLVAVPYGHTTYELIGNGAGMRSGFITYLQLKQAAGIINMPAPGTTQPPAYVVHIFPPCNFVSETLNRVAPNLIEPLKYLEHLLIVITTV